MVYLARFILLFLLLSFGRYASAAELGSPIGVAFIAASERDYFEFPSPQDNVYGFRFGMIRSLNRNVIGLDLGLMFSETRGYFYGIGISGLVNKVYERAHIVGLQLAGLYNVDAGATIVGFQIASFKNHITSDAKVIGLQLAAFSNQAARTNVYGMQISLVNRARKVAGLQLGLVNVADNLYGIQLGLVNVNINGPIKFFPGINIGF